MSDAKTIMEMIKENDISYVDLRFTDPRGKMQHVTQHIDTIDKESLAEGFMFDGSSIAGWKAINESDMKLMPDLSRAYVDPFFSHCVYLLLRRTPCFIKNFKKNSNTPLLIANFGVSNL